MAKLATNGYDAGQHLRYIASLVDYIAFGWFTVVGTLGAYEVARRALVRRSRRARLRTAPSLSPTMPEGATVRVTGTVRAVETLTAPLSGRPCVVHSSRVD